MRREALKRPSKTIQYTDFLIRLHQTSLDCLRNSNEVASKMDSFRFNSHNPSSRLMRLKRVKYQGISLVITTVYCTLTICLALFHVFNIPASPSFSTSWSFVVPRPAASSVRSSAWVTTPWSTPLSSFSVSSPFFFSFFLFSSSFPLSFFPFSLPFFFSFFSFLFLLF